MIRGLYTGASGMIAESIRNDSIANNLANVNTAGFKKDVAVNREFGEMLINRINDGGTPGMGSLGRGSMIDQIATIHTSGAMRSTGNDFDLAIEGKGFFTVETPAGVRYTRNGTFARNIMGDLVTGDGYQVLGQNGRPVRITGNKMTVADDGRVLSDGIEVARLQVVEFAKEKQLTKEGASLYAASANAASQPATGRVRQGFIEASNVNVIAEMVNLINGYRTYEANAKTVQAQDQLLDKAANDVGRV